MFRRFILISSWFLPLLLLAGWAWWPEGLWIGGWAVLLGVHGVYLAGTLWPNSGWFCPAVRRFSTPHSEI